MAKPWKQRLWLLRWRVKQRINAMGGAIAVALLRLIRRLDRRRTSDFLAGALRAIGPFLPEHRTGRANLKAAFPEKSPAEIEAILSGVWDNLGRIAAEFAQLDRLTIAGPGLTAPADIACAPETLERLKALREGGKPALVFAAHLANWEAPARAAAAIGVEAGILFRPPNIRSVAEAVERVRDMNMGTLIASGPDAPFRLAALLDRGAHVGMLVDQHYDRGVEVEFFGRRCKANPTLARLARHFDAPIYGLRAIRTDRHRFIVELSEPIAALRDAQGGVDVQATMQAITSVVERWVREHPDQWLWLHRRWR